MRRKQLVAAAAIALTLVVVKASPTFHRMTAVARDFHRTFQNIKDPTHSLNPIDRVLFSLALVTSKPAPEPTAAHPRQPRS